MKLKLKSRTLFGALGLAALTLVWMACTSQAIESEPDHMRLGEHFHAEGQWARASEELRQVVAANPHNIEAHRLLGDTYLNLNRSEDAIRHLEVLAARETTNVQVYIQLAKLYERRKNYDQALACALQVNKLAPNNWHLGNLLGRAYFNKGQYDQAVLAYEKALGQSDRAWVRNNLGLLYIQQKRWDKAMEELTKAIYLDAKNATVRNNLGVVYQNLGKLEQARRQYKAAVELQPDYQKARNNLDDVTAKIEAGHGG
jgi:Flp pilus assembly protein TadD